MFFHTDLYSHSSITYYGSLLKILLWNHAHLTKLNYMFDNVLNFILELYVDFTTYIPLVLYFILDRVYYSSLYGSFGLLRAIPQC